MDISVLCCNLSFVSFITPNMNRIKSRFFSYLLIIIYYFANGSKI